MTGHSMGALKGCTASKLDRIDGFHQLAARRCVDVLGGGAQRGRLHVGEVEQRAHASAAQPSLAREQALAIKPRLHLTLAARRHRGVCARCRRLLVRIDASLCLRGRLLLRRIRELDGD